MGVEFGAHRRGGDHAGFGNWELRMGNWELKMAAATRYFWRCSTYKGIGQRPFDHCAGNIMSAIYYNANEEQHEKQR
jgi:hypothetical protein